MSKIPFSKSSVPTKPAVPPKPWVLTNQLSEAAFKWLQENKAVCPVCFLFNEEEEGMRLRETQHTCGSWHHSRWNYQITQFLKVSRPPRFACTHCYCPEQFCKIQPNAERCQLRGSPFVGAACFILLNSEVWEEVKGALRIADSFSKLTFQAWLAKKHAGLKAVNVNNAWAVICYLYDKKIGKEERRKEKEMKDKEMEWEIAREMDEMEVDWESHVLKEADVGVAAEIEEAPVGGLDEEERERYRREASQVMEMHLEKIRGEKRERDAEKKKQREMEAAERRRREKEEQEAEEMRRLERLTQASNLFDEEEMADM
ncbi:hypothetical protein ABW19_dt0206921 [Dactylella cylindrospora]|nr:hypothetical protein ABW19_dt0206921 [Dactylella cylindrospora]